MSNNIIDSIQLSGVTYTIQGSGGGNPTVELTQAEYDALVESGAVQTNTYYIITDAQAGDLTQYWTSAQTNSAINQATSGKVDTSAITSSVTSASTENEIPTAKAVYDAIPQGGGGKTVSAGTNISVTTGETADTVSCTLPISARTNNNIEFGSVNNTFSINSSQLSNVDFNHINGTNNTITANSSLISSLKNNFINGNENSINFGNGISPTGNYNTIVGSNNTIENTVYVRPKAENNFIYGFYNLINGSCSFVFGEWCSSKKSFQYLLGKYINGFNDYETSVGQFNNSVSASTTFGDSGNTLFSVGNGTADNARHNAFEIRQNGDIYLNDGTNDVKLQDYLQIKAVKVTQAEYDALVTKDNSTLYVIIN